MSKKIVFSFICAIGLSATFYWFYQPSTSYAFRQVKAIAPAQDNLLLSINHHIRHSKRPNETFTFPIMLGEQGPSNSLYSGKNQYPFYCMSLNSGLGQPEVDNQQGFGVPVYQSATLKEQIIGYSKDCGIKSRLNYYLVDDYDISLLDISAPLKKLNKNQQILRVEQGSINRFIYTLIMPIKIAEIGDRFAQSQWNKKLIYQFNGGSGIGYRQGRQVPKKIMDRQIQQLLDGYAVISSSGNRTSYTYNMLLAEDTARRVKMQFTSLYGEPLYTVGIGGSGGGLAQYLIAQNSKDILDGLIPLYSYPDMITQTTYALDCDLLNNYFTFRAKDRNTWNDWGKRQTIEGMNAINGFPQKAGFLQPVNQLMAGFVPSLPKGNSECINGYFGLSSFINNPQQGFIRDFFHPDVVKETKWSYWQDLSFLLGKEENGFGLTTWDNEGVQYGLLALKNKLISIDEFLDINQKTGSWKAQHEMAEETILTPFGRKKPLWLSLWGNQNITEVKKNADEIAVATRHKGSISAMNAAYRSGQVFIGKVDVPIIDIRHYLEDELDMHHMSASFYSRLRIEQANGHAENHIIWVSHKDFNPAHQAFVVMDEWLLRKKGESLLDTVKAKPNHLQDSCFTAEGAIIAQGKGIWNGKWNGNLKGDKGVCLKSYPMFSTSRIQSGANWAGDLFKCALIPVEKAIINGTYGDVAISEYIEQLNAIFPTGVCDYSQGDLGRPEDL
jgi:hypothetical protein